MPCLINSSLGVYRSRQPAESDFHRLIQEHFDAFRAVYAECYARKFGHWRPVFDRAVREFLRCGDLHQGFARVRCPDCRHEFLVAFSCKQRCIPNAVPGGVLAVQTFGTLIHFHPHLHGLITDGAFLPDGRFLPVPANLTDEPFRRLWEHKVFRLLLDEGRIEPSVVEQMRSWRHSGFNVDRSVRLAAGDRDGLERLAQYMARSPFSLARLVRITPAGKVLYKAEKDRCQRYPQPASEDLFGGVARNFQVFEPLDFLAELVQHTPNKGEHLVRYYGHYSSKARGLRARNAAAREGSDAPAPPIIAEPARLNRRRWAMLIKHVYQADPLLCPKCGGTMKIIAFIEAHQTDVIRKILEHLGLWHDPPPRAPPACLGPSWIAQSTAESDSDPGISYEVDPDFLEHTHREAIGQLELPWEP